jgi:hypothetical protein
MYVFRKSILLERVFITTILLITFLLLTIQTASAADIKIMDDLSTGEGWTFDTGVSIADGLITCNMAEAANAKAVYTLPETVAYNSKWRFEARFKASDPLPDASHQYNFYIGVANSSSDLATWRVMGQRYTTPGVSAYQGAYSTLMLTENMTAGAYYRIQIVSDGVNLTYSITNDTYGQIYTSVKPVLASNISCLFIAFSYSGIVYSGGLDSVSFQNNWNGYDNAGFNSPMRFYTYTGTSTLSYIEVPGTYKNEVRVKKQIDRNLL